MCHVEHITEGRLEGKERLLVLFLNLSGLTGSRIMYELDGRRLILVVIFEHHFFGFFLEDFLTSRRQTTGSGEEEGYTVAVTLSSLST